MEERILITGATIVNENRVFEGSVLISDGLIEGVFRKEDQQVPVEDWENIHLIDGRGLHLFPGIIDDHVHFREPGYTQKGDIYTESKAAVAGGITSYMEMPNTDPKAVTLAILEEKYRLASQRSLANYSFFLGATNDNFSEVEKADP
jgi:dihydroorotase